MLAADPNDVRRAAFAGHATGSGSGYGVEGTSSGGAGVFAWSAAAPDWDPPFQPSFTGYTGVFGYSPASPTDTFGTGVWGDSPDTGVYGSGSTGVYGYGGSGVVGEANDAADSVGVLGYAPSNGQYALAALGKVHFSRSGRKSIGDGKSNVIVNLSGVKSSSLVFAVLATSETGRWVRAVVPAAGKFTVYLNASLRSSASVSWFVLDV